MIWYFNEILQKKFATETPRQCKASHPEPVDLVRNIQKIRLIIAFMKQNFKKPKKLMKIKKLYQVNLKKI